MRSYQGASSISLRSPWNRPSGSISLNDTTNCGLSQLHDQLPFNRAIASTVSPLAVNVTGR